MDYDLTNTYRSVIRPNPLWEEQVCLGSYNYINIGTTSEVWISRKWEPYVLLITDILNGVKHDCRILLPFIHVLIANMNKLPFEWQVIVKRTYPLLHNVNCNSQSKLDDIIVPPFNVHDNTTKLQNIIKSLTRLNVIGYSCKFDKVIRNMRFKPIVLSDTNMWGNIEVGVTKDELIKKSEREIVFVAKDITSCKSSVVVWNNIIVYD